MIPYKVSVTMSEKYLCSAVARNHHVMADEPIEVGGTDMAQSPNELLLSSLGSCTAITMKMYAERKGWSFTQLHIELTLVTESSPNGKISTINRIIDCAGNFGEKEKERLLHIAEQCPVSKILSGTIHIHSILKENL